MLNLSVLCAVVMVVVLMERVCVVEVRSEKWGWFELEMQWKWLVDKNSHYQALNNFLIFFFRKKDNRKYEHDFQIEWLTGKQKYIDIVDFKTIIQSGQYW